MGRLILIAVAGAAIFGLSFVDAWIVHERVVLGEGYRRLDLAVDAWRLGAVPLLTAGVLAALATAACAVVAWRRRSERRLAMPLVIGSAITAALIGAALVPVGVDRHATSLQLSPGWAAWVGAALAVLMFLAAAALSASSRSVALIGVAGIVAVAALGGARWLSLELEAGTGRHWSDGSYSRTVDGEQWTLTIADGRFEIGDRWSGTWESSGWTVVLAADPACPDARGTYHAHGEGELGIDLRFVKVVDTCGDGERAVDLEGGVWQRDG